MSRKRLPPKPTLVLDEKFVNLLRYYQIFAEELEKPQKKLIHVASLMGDLSEISEVIIERLRWLFETQFPREKFVWGKVKKFSALPDKMPQTLQQALKRYKERNGL